MVSVSVIRIAERSPWGISRAAAVENTSVRPVAVGWVIDSSFRESIVIRPRNSSHREPLRSRSKRRARIQALRPIIWISPLEKIRASRCHVRERLWPQVGLARRSFLFCGRLSSVLLTGIWIDNNLTEKEGILKQATGKLHVNCRMLQKRSNSEYFDS